MKLWFAGQQPSPASLMEEKGKVKPGWMLPQAVMYKSMYMGAFRWRCT